MGSIQRMSEDLANRIAAGEVVERPASVLKELVENSLDAGAQTVHVTLRGAGIELLTVEDDGLGMDEADARACFERHATSKLTDDAQLFRLATMGFRGEALASIASVAKVTLQTAAVDGQGTEVVCMPGQPMQVRAFSRSRGTRMTVSDLFFNTPARRQFLKTERGETGAITTWLTRLALAHPQVTFVLRDERRERMRAQAAQDPQAIHRRVEALLGKGLEGGLHCYEATREGYGVTVYAARPDLSRRDRRGLMVFINGRFIEDRRLQQAVVEGFRSVLEVGRNPVAAIFLTVPPGLVDVNVHPQKTEVRLAQPRLVFSLIRQAIVDGLVEAPWLEQPEGLAPGPALPVRVPQTSVFGAPTGGGGQSGLQALSRTVGTATLPRPRVAGPVSAPPTTMVQPVPPEPSLLKGVRYADLRPIGQVATTYLLLEGPDGLVVIDQHAAHERLVFGRLQCALGGEHLPQQGLLMPLQLVLDDEEEAELEAHQDVVTRFGFGLERQGDHLVVTAVPALLSGADPQRLLGDLAGALAAGDGEAELERAFDAVIARLACHGSIRAGQRLSNDEILALMRDLDDAEHRSHCPHGRPFVVRLSEEALERWFHRD